jgi:hypothetical protein
MERAADEIEVDAQERSLEGGADTKHRVAATLRSSYAAGARVLAAVPEV